jgi:hypothetical protein
VQYFNLLHQVVAVAEEIGLEVQVIAFNNTYAHVIVRNCFPIVCMFDHVHVLLNGRSHFKS